MQPPPPLVPLLAGAFVVHFPRLRMYQPSWPYSSASCRLSCSIRHVGITAGAFHVCRPPGRAEPSPGPGSGAPTAPAPCSGTIPVCQTQVGPDRSGVMPEPQSRLWPRRSLPRRAPGGHAPQSSGRFRGLQPAKPMVAKTLASAPWGTWGKLCRLDDFTKRSRSVTGDKQSPLPREAVLSAIILRLCPRPLWKAFRQDQAPRSITNFTQN